MAVEFLAVKTKSKSRIMNAGFLFMITMTGLATATDGVTRFHADGQSGLQAGDEIEIRLEFTSLDPSVDSASLFIAISRDGRVSAVRYQFRDRATNAAAYEGLLPEAEVQRLFARVRSAFRLPKHRRDYDPKLAYESDGFYLAIKSNQGKYREMSGGLETRPDDVRALVMEMTELWKRLNEVPPAYAYLTSRPVEQDRLRLLKSKYKIDLTPIESLSADLQSLLIPVVTQPLNFYPLTQEQYNQLKSGKLAVTFKNRGYELTMFLSAKERA